MSHTPGPWRIGTIDYEFGGPDQPYDIEIYAGDHAIVSRGYEGDGGIQKMDDARLIAAAPELYVALKEFIEYAQGIAPREEGDRRYDQALAALAKSERPMSRGQNKVNDCLCVCLSSKRNEEGAS